MQAKCQVALANVKSIATIQCVGRTSQTCYHDFMRHEEPLVKMTIDRNALSVSPVVNTKGYHDAFTEMPIPKPVAEGAYREAGRIL